MHFHVVLKNSSKTSPIRSCGNNGTAINLLTHLEKDFFVLKNFMKLGVLIFWIMA